MIKLLGAGMILCCGLLIGCGPLLKMRERIHTLGVWVWMLEKMKAELCTSCPTTPQLVERLAEEFLFLREIVTTVEQNGAVSFYEAWYHVVADTESFSQRERAELHSLGEGLGRYVMEEQLQFLERTAAVLEEGIWETRDKLKNVTRLYIGTSLSVSAMVVVMLL